MIQYSNKKCVIGVNISVDATFYAVVDVRGNIIAQDQFPTLDYPNIADYVTVLSEKLVAMMLANGGYDTIRSVGIGVHSGNYVRGSIEDSGCLPWKGKIPLGSMLRDQLGMAVAVGNNAHVRALGEHTFGCAHGMNDFVIITLGPGMGSCFFSNGKPHLGNDGFAGEIGHVFVKNPGRQCGCGRHGCLEAYCASYGVERTARKLLSQSDEPSLMRDCEDLTYQKIIDFCEQGDPLAIKTYSLTGELLGIGLANYASVINPEAFIFTGGIADAGHWLFDSAHRIFEENVFHNLRGKVKFLNSPLSDNERCVLGASVLAWEEKEYSLFK